jgi:hypothetical protein
MASRHCCCKIPGCVVHTDNFTRLTTDEINPPNGSWNVIEPAEWKIEDGRLRHIVPGPIITTKQQTEPPRTTGAGYTVKVYAKLMDITTENNVFAVICSYVNVLNYKYVKFEWNGVSSMWPEFRSVDGGVDTLVMDRYTHPGGIPLPISEEPDDLDPESTIRVCYVKVCYGPADWTADTGEPFESGYGTQISTEIPWTTTSGGQGLLSPGLGMGGFLYGWFDEFAYHIHWESDEICDYCSCLCRHPDPDLIDEYSAVPESVRVTFVPANFTSSEYPCSINNKEIVLTQVPIEGDPALSPTKKIWSNRESLGTPDDVAATLFCNAPGGEERFFIKLYMPSEVGSFTFGTSGGAYMDWDLSSCVPLNLVADSELHADATTCEFPEASSIMGWKSPLCIGGGCIVPMTDEDRDYINSLRWKVVITAA